MMFGESNDVFVATPPDGIPLADAFAGEVEFTNTLKFWDAGTEPNQAPGLGDQQPARQQRAGDGGAEGGVITEITDGVDGSNFRYPLPPVTLKLTIKPAQ